MGHGRRADGVTQSDVEKMIMDYFAYEGNKAVLEDHDYHRRSSKRISFVETGKTEAAMENIKSFASIFNQHFPGEKLDSKASFRVKLLQLNILFSHRAYPGFPVDAAVSLETLKTSHSRRRSHFVQSRASCPLSRTWLGQLPVGIEYRSHYVELLRQNNINIEPPLLKLLPLFCKLSAYRGALESNSSSITKNWMNLAGQFMMQACLEILLVHGTSDADLLREAFSWSWKSDGNVDEVFANQGEREMAEWERIRTAWAGVLTPGSKQVPLAHHLIQVAAAYPVHTLESDLTNFLQTLHDAGSLPRLLQVEDGQIDGLTAAQSIQLLKRARVSL